MKEILKKSPAYLLIVSLLVAIVIVLSLIRAEMKLSFPSLEQGIYLGALEDVGEGKIVPIIVKSEGISADSHFTVLCEGYSTKNYLQMNKSLLPLELRGASGRLKFVGKIVNDGVVEGEVFNLDKQTRSKWSIQRVSTADPLQILSDDIVERFSILQKLSDIKDENAKVLEQYRSYNVAAEEVRALLNNEEELDRKVNERLASVRKELLAQERDLVKVKQRARALAKKLVFAEKLTDAGKLVSLSRKILKREDRWIESTFQRTASFGGSHLDEDYTRAERMIELQTRIKEARSKLGIDTTSESMWRSQ